jgi:DNA-binding Lrp family transcriptional regulator
VNLNSVDKEILKILLAPDGWHTSKSIAEKLQMPLSTVLRHRIRLEEELIKSYYILDIEKIGWRRVDFFISTNKGKTDSISKELIKMDQVTSVGKSIGEHTIDIRCELIVKDNGNILTMLEEIKAMDGVNDVVWSEIVWKVEPQKMSVPASIIDQF